MLEQQTLKAGIDLASQYGPLGTVVFIFIGWQIYYSINMKKHAVDPSVDNRKKIDELVDKLHKVELEVRDRVPFAWAEGQLVPKIDKMSEDINKLSLATERYSTIVDSQIKVGEHLALSIDKLTDRLSSVESLQAHNK